MSTATSTVLGTERGATLRSVTQRILPGVAGVGAQRADVAAAIEQAFAHPVVRPLVPAFEGLLDQLRAQALERHSRAFEACTESQQDELLRALERDSNPWSRTLFRSLIALAIEGLLGDPAHGGNRDFAGWRSIGYAADDVRSGFCRGAREA